MLYNQNLTPSQPLFMTPSYLPLHPSARRNTPGKYSVTRKPVERRIRRRWKAAELMENFVDRLKTQSEVFGRILKEPYDQWPWLLVVLPPNNDLTVVGITRTSLNKEEARAALSVTVQKLAKEYNAVALAFLCGSRVRESLDIATPDSSVPGTTSVSTEVVMIEEAHADSVSVHLANVQRSPDKPPTLGTWSQIENPRLHARFVTASQPILQANYDRFVS